MTTLLALVAISQLGSGSIGDDYSREVEKRFWLVGPIPGTWHGRVAGPFSEEGAAAIIEDRWQRMSNSASGRPDDLKELGQVLATNDEELPDLLLSGEPKIVRNAIGEAALRRAKITVPALIKLSESGEFQTEAIASLATIGGPEAIRCLRYRLKDNDTEVRAFAAYGLAAHKRKDGASALWFALRNPVTGELYHDSRIRGSVARALLGLGEINTRRELDEVFKLTDVQGRYLCPLMARSGKPLYLAKLRDLVVDQSVYHGVRKWAINGLSEIKDRRSLPYLKKALNDPIRHVREAAGVAIDHIS